MIASAEENIRPDVLQRTSEALLGRGSNLRLWPEAIAGERSDFRAAVGVSGLLPEDKFDRQPILSEDRDTVFVCQARLDNREDLLRALDLPQATASHVADSAILYRCFLKWGRVCMGHLAGDYAFVAFSHKKKELFGATDHVGHTRLFYALAEGRLIVSTQLTAIRACPYLKPTMHEQALGLCAEAVFLKGQTPFREISALPGGHSLLWSNGQVKITRWWAPQDKYQARFSNAADYVESARELFEKAVQSCLRSSSPVSATLSGGLDSGLVTSMAAKQLRASGQSITAYTSAPHLDNPSNRRTGWDADDAPFAAKTAAFHQNIEHIVLRTDGRTALDLIPQIHARSATPVRNGANHLWIDTIAHRLRERGSRVLLTGAHGNFALSYSGLGGFRELCQHLQFRAAFGLALDMQAAGDRAAWKTIAGGLLPQSLFDALRFRVYGEKVSQSLPACLLASDFQKANSEALRRLRPPQRTRKAFLRGALSPAMLWAADPLPQWGIEFRDPTSDRRLIELLLSFPLAAFSPAGQSRGLAREAGRGVLPESVRLRRTQGQQSADYSSSMARQCANYRQIAEDMAESPACIRLLDLALLRRAIYAVANGETSPVLTGRIDRAADIGLFLLRQNAGG
ncbi:asparagine synthase-related protein [Terriglobus saanensis]|uniref:asparagine synthase-related protein n=1 Tax=Terriglobus saanensis TaxID=870903 RepID=UPI001FE1E594|nr:asparagine synthase-related protein [Terriglobus saanensis]